MSSLAPQDIFKKVLHSLTMLLFPTGLPGFGDERLRMDDRWESNHGVELKKYISGMH